jgi:hypothetical protein
MRRLRVQLRPGATAAILASSAMVALPALPSTAQAHTQARVEIAAPAAHAVSGSIPFAVRDIGHGVRKIVFKVDGQSKWTTTERPFRYHRTGRLNTLTLANGIHELSVRASYAHQSATTVREQIVVRNQASFTADTASIAAGHHKHRKPTPPVPTPPVPTPPVPTPPVPTPPVPTPPVPTPPVGGVAGGPTVFNRVTYNYKSVFSTVAEANMYQVMVLQSTNGSMVSALHAANPKLIILMYQHPWVANPSDPTALSRCTSYQSDLANHPSWFLRDQSGNLIDQPGYAGDYLMDIGNPAYQQACAAGAAAQAKKLGFDGVFFDGIASTLQWEIPKGTTVPEYPTLASWQAAMTSWVTYSAATLHAQGLKAFGNLCGTTLTAGLWQKWAAPYDGAMEESWTDGGQGLAQQISAFPTKLADAAWSAANGKMVLEHSYNGTETGNTFGLGSLMLVNNGTLSYSTSNTNYTSDESNYPEYATATSLGAPTGSYVKLSSGVYERAFANGVVLVNATTSSVPSFSLGGGIYSGSQLNNVTSVSMGATSSLILLKVG